MKLTGFVTLISVLIVGTVGAAIAVSLVLLGTDNYRVTANVEDSRLSQSLSDACSEKALDALRSDINYAGNETINFTKGSCQILPIIGNGSENPIVQTTGNVNSLIRKNEIEVIQVSGQVKVGTWREVADFVN